MRDMLMLVMAGLCLLAAGAQVAGMAIPRVPDGHPRVYVRASDLPGIRAKLALPEFQSDWQRVQEAAQEQPLAGAFVYLVQGDRATGRAAVDRTLTTLEESTDGRVFESPTHWAACVYDWCYDLLTPDEKQAFIKEFLRIATSHDPGYPAAPDPGAVVGHVAEGWLLTGQLPEGVAIYDESHTLYDAAARLFVDKFVPARNFHYQGHSHHQGDSYQSRFAHDLAAAWLFRRMGAGDVFSADMQYVGYQGIYWLRPDGQQLRAGDTYDDAGRQNSRRRIALLAGAYYHDPYLLTLADSDLFQRRAVFDCVLELLFREPNVVKRPLSELPLTKYFAPPTGEMVARTGWEMGKDSTAAVVHMRIGEVFFGNHQRRDFGTFQIYYRGALAIPSGVYEGTDSGYGTDHWNGYYHQTLAHNGLLVFDPKEPTERLRPFNDGGQRVPPNGADHPVNLDWLLHRDYCWGVVTAHAIGPQAAAPEYSYLAGDITKAYSAKVRTVTRAMVTLHLDSETYPAALVVFDRVVSADPAFKKTWLLHSMEQPAVAGRTISIARTEDGYHGRLVTQSLLPEHATLTVVGGPGKEFWVESAQRNLLTTKKPPAEAGAWRVEVSPATPAAEDVFLHVLTVMDASTTEGPTVRKLEGTGLVGVQVLNRAVLFSREGKALEQASFTLAGPGDVKALVCDLKPGRWTVTRDGTAIVSNASVDPQGECLYFTANAGEYRLHRTG
jgi:hypothetical protein